MPPPIQQSVDTSQFTVESLLPPPPAFSNLDDQRAFSQWHEDFQVTLRRQFSEVTAKISNHESRITTLEP